MNFENLVKVDEEIYNLVGKELEREQEGYGFDGIAVALIANSNPIGVIFSGLLFGAFKYGGIKMQSVNAPSEVINIVIGSIVYFIALSNGLRILYKKMKEKKAKGGAA